MEKRAELKVPGFMPIYKGVPPFKKFAGGFGYVGVMLEHTETGKIQCHLCGKLVNSVAKHLFHAHKGVSPISYRKTVGLNLTAPLVSPSTSKKHKNNFLNLTDEKREKVIMLLRKNNKLVHSRDGKRLYVKRKEYSSAQYENRFGTCPEQAKTLFWEEYKKFGRIPSTDEMSGKLKHIVFSRFSSYKNALIAWGMSDRERIEYFAAIKQKAVDARAEKDYFPKYKIADVKKKFQDFFETNHRFPTWGEVQRAGMPGRAPFMRAFGMNKSDLQRQLINEQK